MHVGFAQESVVAMDAPVDAGAPGAAITVALCGHWEHEPPCPLAPHHSAATMAGSEVKVRTVFAAKPADVAEVRRRIEAALAGGCVGGPGSDAKWRLVSTTRVDLQPDEEALARRLAASAG